MRKARWYAHIITAPSVLYNFPTGLLMSEALRRSALLTDLYELTMAAAYFENGFRADASFELFVRSLPPQRAISLPPDSSRPSTSWKTFVFSPRTSGSFVGILRSLTAATLSSTT